MKFALLSLLILVQSLHAAGFDGLEETGDSDTKSLSSALKPDTELRTFHGSQDMPESLTSRVSGKKSYRWVHKSVVSADSSKVKLNGNVNLRTIPYLKTSESPFTARNVSDLPLLGREEDWYKVDVSEKFPDLKIKKFPIAIVNTKNSSLALRPSLNRSKKSIRIWMPKSSRLQILESKGKWSLVKYKNSIGFAFTRYLKKTGEEEEYWHRQVSNEDSGLFNRIAELREQVEGKEKPDSRLVYEYIEKLNEALHSMRLNELNAVILEMEKYLTLLEDLSESENKQDREMALKAQEFRKDKLYNISMEQSKADELFKKGKVNEALIYAKIGALKTKYSNEENLKLLQAILQKKVEEESDENQAKAFREEAEFIRKTLASNAASAAPEVDFSKEGKEGTTGDLPSQADIDSTIAKALDHNKKQEFQEALDLIQEKMESTEGKSVKLKFFLGMQLVKMSEMPQFSELSEGFRAKGEVYVAEAKDGLNDHLDIYPDNAAWREEIEKFEAVSGEDNPGLSDDELRIDEIIADVLHQNKGQYYTRGKNRLLDQDKKYGGKSAKIKYYLAKQYIILAKTYRGKASMFLGKVDSELKAARSLEDKHTKQFTENSVWASKSNTLLKELETVLKEKIESTPVADDSSKPGEVEVEGSTVYVSRFDMNALTALAILESGATCQVETLDVLQVVFNRINSSLFPNTVSGVVFASGQFEPYFPILGRSKRSRRQRIFSSETEAAKYAATRRRGLSRSMAISRMRGVEAGLKDTGKMSAAKRFVNGRVFFLGANMSYHPGRGDVRRKKGCNHYKVGIRSADRRRHRPYMDRLFRKGPTKVMVR